MLVSILIFLIIFSVIVIGHEFGHYAVARRSGIRVNEFDIGMGPTLVKWRRGETDFCIKLLPVGGACIFDGMLDVDGKAADLQQMDEHSFPNASVGARIATVLAGPFANFLIGLVFATVIVSFTGTDLPVVQSIMEDSAAEEAGILPGDTILKLNGSRIHVYREVILASMMNDGEPFDVELQRGDEKFTVTLTPKYSEEDQRYYIGLLGSGEFIRCTPLQVFQYGFYEAEYWVKATFRSLATIFQGKFQKDDLMGPVGVVKVVDDTYTEAKPYGMSVVVLSFMNLATLLSINLGIMNLLPLPALDGGRLLFLILEAIRGKKVSPEKEGMVTLAGALALIVLMIFVLFNDISRFFR